MRVNSVDVDDGDAEDFSAVAAFDLCCCGSCCWEGLMADEGASYSTRVGRPNAVISAGETIGDVYKLGGGSLLLMLSSTASLELLLLLLLLFGAVLLNVK